MNTLIIALWPQVSPTVAWALTCIAWGCVPASLSGLFAVGWRAAVAARNCPR